jgi:mono/diheme cytochrome c family protein
MSWKLPALIAFNFPLVAAVCFAATAAASETVLEHPVIPGFERFYANSAAERTAGGRLLLGELNCIACHKTEEAAKLSIVPRPAPVLDAVGERVRPDYLRAFLLAPRAVKPGTLMPDLLAGLPASQKVQQVEALIHFLASTGGAREMAVMEQSAGRGEELFHRIGCVACHQPKGETPLLATSVPLGDLTQKYTLPALAAFLRDPLHVRPSGRMPSLNLSEDEARDVASFLLRGLEVPGNVHFAYFEGGWDKLPDFDKLQPQATGTAPAIDVGVGRRRDQFGVRFEGFLQIEREGEYRFHLGSDDGSRLKIDGKLVVDNDEIHSTTWKEARIKLAPGPHALRVEYFEQGGEEVLKVEYEGPGLSRRPVEYALTLTADGRKEGGPEFRADPSLAAEGRKLFASLGCASCHAMKADGAAIESQLQPPALAKLAPDQGCLSESPKPGVPSFGLSSQQKLFLRATVEAAATNAIEPLAEKAAVSHLFTAFNCFACHERDQIGGVERERNAFFEGAIPEMGDEGRIPPHLTGAGEKLRSDWIGHIFSQGAKDRPYMHTRMPKFGAENVGALVGLLKAVDDQPQLALPEIKLPPRRMKSIGHRLVGDQGLSCIKCHTFGDLKSTGVQAMSLTTMHRRLNEDWYHRYMLNPPAFRPGTRMPAPWPGGVSLLPDILDGDALRQIHATWIYLSDGDDAAVPRGLTQGAMELVATDRAVLYRNFIEGAGPRAIGVGYPEKANLAFDANGMRLALLWHGAFIDASKHWVGRGAGFQPPLGRNVLKLPDGAPLAKLDSPESPWPTPPAREQGYRFQGYRLDPKDRPTFLYSYSSVEVEDFPEAVDTEDEPILRRTFLIKPDDTENLWLRAAAADSIERDAEWFVIDNDWRTRIIAETAEPIIRESNGRRELLLLVNAANGAVTIVQEYLW